MTQCSRLKLNNEAPLLHLIYISCTSVSTFVLLATVDLTFGNKFYESSLHEQLRCNFIKVNPMPLCKLTEQSVLMREINPLQNCSVGPDLLHTAVRRTTTPSLASVSLAKLRVKHMLGKMCVLVMDTMQHSVDK